VDDSDNHKPVCREALYVGTLVVNTGSTIDLNGRNLYFLKDAEPKQLFPGDANIDGCVDGADYTLWADNYQTPGMGWCGGDFNADGNTDGADYTLWADNYTPGGSSVPEPATLSLLALGACLPLLRRRR
jgi:hypothetical protein